MAGELSPDQLALAYELLEKETAKENAPVETDSGEGPADENRSFACVGAAG